MPYVVGGAIGVFCGAVGKGIVSIAPGVSDVLALTGSFIGVAMFVLAFIELVDQRQIVAHRLEEMRLRNLLIGRDLAPQPKPGLPVPFAPLAFVEFIWTHRHPDGMFQTLDECAAIGRFPRGRAQMWCEAMERAGAIVDRIEKVQAGRPAPGWTRERFEEAARTGGYTPDPTPLPLPAERAFGMTVSGPDSTAENTANSGAGGIELEEL